MEGFDHYGVSLLAAKGWALSGQASASMVSGRFGGQALNNSTNNNSAYVRSLTAAAATIIIGFAFKTDSPTNNPTILQWTSGRLVMGTSGGNHVLLAQNAGGTTIGTGTTNIVANTWYYIEIKNVVGTSGTIEVHLNGATEIASTVGNFGTTNNTSIQTFYSPFTGNNTYDDFYVCNGLGSTNNNFLGDVRVVTAVPIGAGAHTQFQPNGSASNWQCVDEIPPNDDTDYVSDANPGDIDTYDITSIDGGASVFGVQNSLYARKDDANVRQIAAVARQAGTDYVGATKTLGSSYLYYSELYDQDPTAANWTATNVNADEFGVKEIA
jgi:hypothetical protein